MASRTRFSARTLALVLASLPAVALAHPGHESGANFAAGVLHPASGLDHLLALLAVGALAARMRGLAGLGIALPFLGLIAVGFALGLRGVEIPFAEILLTLSVAVSAALALRPPRNLPVFTALLAGAFALLHGTAHGQEAVAGIERLPYAAGLVAGSALLLVAGALLALAIAFPLAHGLRRARGTR